MHVMNKEMDTMPLLRLYEDDDDSKSYEYEGSGDEATLMQDPDINSLQHDEGEPLCVCDRKNFNNFLWATMTVFQVRKRRQKDREYISMNDW